MYKGSVGNIHYLDPFLNELRIREGRDSEFSYK